MIQTAGFGLGNEQFLPYSRRGTNRSVGCFMREIVQVELTSDECVDRRAQPCGEKCLRVLESTQYPNLMEVPGIQDRVPESGNEGR